MQFNIIPYTKFVFVMFMVFPSQIFAAWTLQNPPKKPTDGVKRTCAQWIIYNGFTNDLKTNREKALNRNIMFDRLATTWAAMYAFKIGGKRDLYQLYPGEFCNIVDLESSVPKDFIALENDKHTCENWIKLYRFNENHVYNVEYANNLNHMNAVYISYWAYSYWRFLWFNKGEKQLTPKEVCSKMGQSVGDDAVELPFISEHGLKLECRDWLRLYNFCAPEAETNLHKARLLMNDILEHTIRVHLFAKLYAFRLVKTSEDEQPIDYLTPEQICETYDGNGAEPRKYEFDCNIYLP